MISVAVAVYIVGLLLACGDAEANPGPLETTVTGDNAGDNAWAQKNKPVNTQTSKKASQYLPATTRK